MEIKDNSGSKSSDIDDSKNELDRPLDSLLHYGLVEEKTLVTTIGESSSTQVALLHRISSIVSSDQDIESILKELVSLAINVTHSDACLVYLIDYVTNEIVLRASQLPHDAEIGNVRLKMGEGITGWVAAHNSVVALPRSAS